MLLDILKRSGVDPEDPTPEGAGTTPEGSLTLVSNLVLVVDNIGLDILGDLLNLILLNTELKYIELNKLVNLSIEPSLKKNTQQLL